MTHTSAKLVLSPSSRVVNGLQLTMDFTAAVTITIITPAFDCAAGTGSVNRESVMMCLMSFFPIPTFSSRSRDHL